MNEQDVVSLDDAVPIVLPKPEVTEAIKRTKKVDANDIMARGPGSWRLFARSKDIQKKSVVVAQKHTLSTTVGVLMKKHPKMRESVVDGLLRRSEVMNVIAPPKKSKTFMTVGLALTVATGGKWLGRFQCAHGKSLVLDNELHEETIAERMRTISRAMNVPQAYAGRMIHYMPLRGQLKNFDDLGALFHQIRPREFKIVIMDAFYRFMPKGTDENDNGTMANLYNLLDQYAARLDASIVLVHHTSKGSQANKSITDVGAGGGAQARASDVHLIFREHDDADVVVVDAGVRTYKPVEPFCIRFKYPLWAPAPDCDPDQLKGKDEQKQSTAITSDDITKWNALLARQTGQFSSKQLLERGVNSGVSKWSRSRVSTLIGTALSEGRIITKVPGRGGAACLYETTDRGRAVGAVSSGAGSADHPADASDDPTTTQPEMPPEIADTPNPMTDDTPDEIDSGDLKPWNTEPQ